MGYPSEIMNCPMIIHDGNEFMNQFRGFRPDNMGSQNFAVLRRSQKFDVTMSLTQRQ